MDEKQHLVVGSRADKAAPEHRSPRVDSRLAWNPSQGAALEQSSGGKAIPLDKVSAQSTGMSGPKLSSQPQVRQAKSLQNKDSKSKSSTTARSTLKKRMLAQPLPA